MSREKILIYFDCSLSIICAHLVRSLPTLDFDSRARHKSTRSAASTTFEMQIAQKSINIQLCVHFIDFSFSHQSHFSFDMAMPLEACLNNIRRWHYHTIPSLYWIFVRDGARASERASERTNEWRGPWTTFPSHLRSERRIVENFSWQDFLPCRLVERVKIISSTVRRTDISVKFYLNNIL